MINKIRKLEETARLLEPDSEQREYLLSKVIEYSEEFLREIYDSPAFQITEDKGIGLYDSPISDDPVDLDSTLNLLKYNVDRPGLNPASGGHIAYIPGGGIFLSALGDYLASITNRYSGIFFASPGAVRMENMLLEWMGQLVGYPKNAAGNLASGGSIANLICIVTARDSHDLKAKDFGRSVVYLTEHVHHCIHKALRIAGLKETIQKFIPTDSQYKMDADILERTILQDKKKGLHPWLIIASAGTTDTGSVDPLPSIGDIAKTHDLWYHIDGAYGAFFVLCQAVKDQLKGMEQSDSIVMDPHKGLFLPYGLGAALVKDRQKLYNAHYYQANYMQDALDSNEELSPADLSPELTKHFRGLRLWLPLKLLGIGPFRAALEEKILLARYFYEKIQETDGFEVGPFPDLSVVIFRYIPKQGDADAFNRRLIQEIHNDGRIFLSSTLLNGEFTIRLAVLSFRTHLDTIELTLKILKEKVKYITENG